MSDNTEFRKELEERTKQINEQIESYLPEEKGHQKTIFEAMNYSVKAGGKRLRPLFMQEICRLFTGEVQPVVVPFMAAIEMIHTSSLVHDDLPCMDDDMMRRGQASTWAEYGEDMGVLAGDALMIYAFEVAAKAFKEVSDADDLKRVGRAIEILASKTGIYGMIGGQTADTEAEELPEEQVTQELLLYIHENKTAALIQSSMMIGAVLAGAADGQLEALERIGSNIGLAFQIQDDILDLTSSLEVLGKQTGSDLKNHKVTYVSLNGMEKSAEQVRRFSEEAIAGLACVAAQEGMPQADTRRNDFLEKLVEDLITRKK